MIWTREAREKMALRVWRWLEQEIGAGCIPSREVAVKGSKGRTVTAMEMVDLAGARVELPLYCKSYEERIERALDCPDLARLLAADADLSYRVWSFCADRLGTEGTPPCLAEVEQRRKVYWQERVNSFNAHAAIERQRSKEAR